MSNARRLRRAIGRAAEAARDEHDHVCRRYAPEGSMGSHSHTWLHAGRTCRYPRVIACPTHLAGAA